MRCSYHISLDRCLLQIKRLQSPDEAAEVFLVENREDGRRYQIKLIERGTLVRLHC